MDKVEKWKRLDELVLQDDLYKFYRRAYCESAAKYDKVCRFFPRKLRNTLEGYADFGRLMMQRMAGIALENMEFKDGPEEE